MTNREKIIHQLDEALHTATSQLIALIGTYEDPSEFVGLVPSLIALQLRIRTALEASPPW